MRLHRGLESRECVVIPVEPEIGDRNGNSWYGTLLPLEARNNLARLTGSTAFCVSMR